jgi:hypothetical protein
LVRENGINFARHAHLSVAALVTPSERYNQSGVATGRFFYILYLHVVFLLAGVVHTSHWSNEPSTMV